MVASSGHKLGQIIGDWWEEYVVLPLISEVGHSLDLFLDHRFIERSCRGKKINWKDSNGNVVDYDYVLEFAGNSDRIGVPVAFFESFWRRGARHSKDKARDDTNKLLPMRSTYPTARFLAIAACGEFTKPAIDYVRSHDVHLFHVGKDSIVRAFKKKGLTIDYADSLEEEKKRVIVRELEVNLTKSVKVEVYKELRKIEGEAKFKAFTDEIKLAIAAEPKSINFSVVSKSTPRVFGNLSEFQAYLDESDAVISPGKFSNAFETSFAYAVTYSDDTKFRADLDSLEQLKDWNDQLTAVNSHIQKRIK